MYNGIDIIPTLEFEHDDLSTPANQLEAVLLDVNSSTLHDFLNSLDGFDEVATNLLDIWEYNPQGNVIGFGKCGRRVLRSIAFYLRGLHSDLLYCGNLFERIHIDNTRMTVSFPYQPGKENFLEGIRKDTTDFRRLVSCLMAKSMSAEDTVLPDDLKFFFSKVFTRGLESPDLDTVRDHSYFQLFHPATFDASDRYSFIHAVGDYLRQTSKKEFQQKTQYFQRLTYQLNRREYKLTGWDSKFANDRTLVKLRNDSIKKSAFRGSAEIPWFLRCVHHHFHAYEVLEYHNVRNPRSHDEIDEALCSLFPGVYSKILDAILRCFYEDRTVLLRGLAQVWETGPYVFKCDKYRPA